MTQDTTAIATWGNEGLPDKNGFATGEEILWLMKYINPDIKTVYYLTPTYTIGCNEYSTNGINVLLELSGETGYHINIETAWHIILR